MASSNSSQRSAWPYSCECCDMVFTGIESHRQHLDSKRHVKKAESQGSLGQITTNGLVERNTSLHPPPANLFPTVANTDTVMSHLNDLSVGLSVASDNSCLAVSGVKETSSSATPSNANSSSVLTPMSCKPCCMNFNSTDQARQHFGSKNHAKKNKFVGAYSAGSFQSIPKMAGTSSVSSLGMMAPVLSSEMTTATMQVPGMITSNTSTSTTTSNTMPVMQPTIPGSITPMICKPCGMIFHDTFQAKQHFEGKVHARKTTNVFAPDLLRNQITTGIPASISNSAAKITEASLPSMPEVAAPVLSTTVNTTATVEPKNSGRVPLKCGPCCMIFNADCQAKQHFASEKHAKKARNLFVGDPLPSAMSVAPTAGKLTSQPFLKSFLDDVKFYEPSKSLDWFEGRGAPPPRLPRQPDSHYEDEKNNELALYFFGPYQKLMEAVENESIFFSSVTPFCSDTNLMEGNLEDAKNILKGLEVEITALVAAAHENAVDDLENEKAYFRRQREAGNVL